MPTSIQSVPGQTGRSSKAYRTGYPSAFVLVIPLGGAQVRLQNKRFPASAYGGSQPGAKTRIGCIEAGVICTCALRGVGNLPGTGGILPGKAFASQTDFYDRQIGSAKPSVLPYSIFFKSLELVLQKDSE